jgi:hypothetical protein
MPMFELRQTGPEASSGPVLRLAQGAVAMPRGCGRLAGVTFVALQGV